MLYGLAVSKNTHHDLRETMNGNIHQLWILNPEILENNLLLNIIDINF